MIKFRNNKKGFTLAELLIVVAIVGVLVAIAIPVFSSSLDTAKKATDDANFRAAKAIAAVIELDENAEINGATVPDTALYFDADAGTFTATSDDAYKAQIDDSEKNRTKDQVIKRNATNGTVTWETVAGGNP